MIFGRGARLVVDSETVRGVCVTRGTDKGIFGGGTQLVVHSGSDQIIFGRGTRVTVETSDGGGSKLIFGGGSRLTVETTSCCVNTGGNKMYFGGGTRLTVETTSCCVNTGGANQFRLIFGRGTRLSVETTSCSVNTALNKIIFGGGTRVTVETKEESKPSYYKLEDKDDSTSVCLATGFSSIRAADEEKKDIFNNRTGAVRIDGDKLYNQVAYLSTEQERKQCEEDTISSVLKQNGSSVCNSLEPDPQMNLVSLTVLGLRLLFMKTVVFNEILEHDGGVSICLQTADTRGHVLRLIFIMFKLS
ncbi:hypothetical protein NQZ68_038574 [Dissostichus eleginoides]|nr:hypothetical protein NQZ68_038574 [Dissostichus eleginoides]